ncbi:hypothetical protein BK666_09500 [Pseudomonas frederiksbergensis]|uniref:Glycosyltransferase RgtA/B/C/D-like domain-containing protein n=1 Tax=Pseudomonas frederiksbergensis TaxID=104087 RepID=A0A423K9U4_9PSED|nr:hypothetical protein [Pseudomonas frederiksbergensis]RON48647.1 hypothetical protein BK666_09500 [Pseudomonas frederiksbergensis]
MTDRLSSSDGAILLGIFIFPVMVLFVSILLMNNGVLIYTLDDPYIHMKMARNIMSGHYGINLGENAAPSSSIIWPFLLAPFSVLGKGFFYVPLVLNVIFSWMTVRLLFQLLSSVAPGYKAIIICGWCLSTNVYGAIFNGMEHSLQVYLTTLIACEVVRREFLGATKVSSVFYLAAFVLPLVRYEGAAVSLPALAYLWVNGERKKSLACGVMILLAVASFSLFLKELGLGLLPSSVLSKSDISDFSSLAVHALNQCKMYGWVIVVVIVFCCFFSSRKSLVMLLLGVTLLHTLLGKSGWYGRYELYWLSFIGVFFIAACVRCLTDKWVAILFGFIPLAFSELAYVTFSTPWASANIYNQQYRMSMIAARLDEPLAINDLGLVSLMTDQYVLDLAGLGSYEALRLSRTQPNALWVGELMKRQGVKYAFIYDEWFSGLPDYFIKVAVLKLAIPNISAAQDSVSLYAVDALSAKKLKGVLVDFRTRNPSDQFEIDYVQ